MKEKTIISEAVIYNKIHNGALQHYLINFQISDLDFLLHTYTKSAKIFIIQSIIDTFNSELSSIFK